MAKFCFYKNGDKLAEKVAEAKVEGDPCTVEWTMPNEGVQHVLEKDNFYVLMVKKLSQDGRFDQKDMKHWDMLPLIFQGSYFYCVKE